MQAQLAAIGRKAIAARPRFGFTDIDLRLPGQQPVTGRLLIGLRPPAEDNLPPQAFLREALDTIDLLIDAPALAWGEAGNAGADSGRIEGLRFTATATPGLASVDADFRLDRLVTHVIGLAGPTDVTLVEKCRAQMEEKERVHVFTGKISLTRKDMLPPDKE